MNTRRSVLLVLVAATAACALEWEEYPVVIEPEYPQQGDTITARLVGHDGPPPLVSWSNGARTSYGATFRAHGPSRGDQGRWEVEFMEVGVSGYGIESLGTGWIVVDCTRHPCWSAVEAEGYPRGEVVPNPQHGVLRTVRWPACLPTSNVHSMVFSPDWADAPGAADTQLELFGRSDAWHESYDMQPLSRSDYGEQGVLFGSGEAIPGLSSRHTCGDDDAIFVLRARYESGGLADCVVFGATTAEFVERVAAAKAAGATVEAVDELTPDLCKVLGPR